MHYTINEGNLKTRLDQDLVLLKVFFVKISKTVETLVTEVAFK